MRGQRYAPCKPVTGEPAEPQENDEIKAKACTVVLFWV